MSLATIDDVDLRQTRFADTLWKRQQRVLPTRRIDPTLHTRRRASKHHHRALISRAHDCGFARVIARRLALLIARFVLLIHDDCAEVLERSEDRRPRANRDSFAALFKREPFVVALSVTQRAVQHRDLVTEHCTESIDRL